MVANAGDKQRGGSAQGRLVPPAAKKMARKVYTVQQTPATPGPWKWRATYGDVNGVVIDQEMGGSVCYVVGLAPSIAEDEANIRLLAAAPELLAALVDMTERASLANDGIYSAVEDIDGPIAVARAVIAKAKGEQP